MSEATNGIKCETETVEALLDARRNAMPISLATWRSNHTATKGECDDEQL